MNILPNEILFNIFKHLDQYQLYQLSLINRRFYYLVKYLLPKRLCNVRNLRIAPNDLTRIKCLGYNNFMMVAKFKNLEYLDCSDNFSNFGCLMFSVHNSLKYLDISNTFLPAQDATNLLSLPNLKTLKCCSVQLSDFSINIIGKLNKLTEFDCSDNYIGGYTQHLTGLTNLEILKMTNARVNSNHILNLAKLYNLKKLIVDSNQLNEYAFTRLTDLTNLEYLDCSNNYLGFIGLRPIMIFNKLETLKCNSNSLGFTGLSWISGLTNLRNLECNSNRLNHSGLSAITNLTKLTYLSCSYNCITSSEIMNCIGLINLRKVVYSGNKLIGIHLRVTAGFPFLEELILTGNLLGDDSLEHISRITTLKVLSMSSNLISELEPLKNLIHLSILKLNSMLFVPSQFEFIRYLSRLKVLQIIHTTVHAAQILKYSPHGFLNIIDHQKIEY